MAIAMCGSNRDTTSGNILQEALGETEKPRFEVMSTGALSGAKMLRWSGALLLIEGLALGTVLRVIRNGRAGVRVRGGRLIVLVADGAFTVVDVGIWMLSGAES